MTAAPRQSSAAAATGTGLELPVDEARVKQSAEPGTVDVLHGDLLPGPARPCSLAERTGPAVGLHEFPQDRDADMEEMAAFYKLSQVLET